MKATNLLPRSNHKKMKILIQIGVKGCFFKIVILKIEFPKEKYIVSMK